MLSDWRPKMPTYTAAQVGRGNGLIAAWLAGDGVYDEAGGKFRVKTPGGWAVAIPGDWILQTKGGAFCVIADADFRSRYEAA